MVWASGAPVSAHTHRHARDQRSARQQVPPAPDQRQSCTRPPRALCTPSPCRTCGLVQLVTVPQTDSPRCGTTPCGTPRPPRLRSSCQSLPQPAPGFFSCSSGSAPSRAPCRCTHSPSGAPRGRRPPAGPGGARPGGRPALFRWSGSFHSDRARARPRISPFSASFFPLGPRCTPPSPDEPGGECRTCSEGVFHTEGYQFSKVFIFGSCHTRSFLRKQTQKCLSP